MKKQQQSLSAEWVCKVVNMYRPVQNAKKIMVVKSPSMCRQVRRLKYFFDLNDNDELKHFMWTQWKEQIIQVELQNIAFFRRDQARVEVVMTDGNKYFVDDTLNALETISGSDFFRVNQRYLVSRKAFDMSTVFTEAKVFVLVNNKKQTIFLRQATKLKFMPWLAMKSAQ